MGVHRGFWSVYQSFLELTWFRHEELFREACKAFVYVEMLVLLGRHLELHLLAWRMMTVVPVLVLMLVLMVLMLVLMLAVQLDGGGGEEHLLLQWHSRLIVPRQVEVWDAWLTFLVKVMTYRLTCQLVTMMMVVVELELEVVQMDSLWILPR